MCYHVTQTKIKIEVEKRFDAEVNPSEDFTARNHYNGFDFPAMPIITDQNPSIITHFNWGLIPHWASDTEIRKSTLNAKIETVNEKPSFKDVVNQRCLIIADGYFEWKWLDAKGKNKQKYSIFEPDHGLFAFAGLYSITQNAQTGKEQKTFTMLTTEANQLMSEIHNSKKRMPIILKREDEQKYLQNHKLENFAFPYSVNLAAEAEKDLDAGWTLFDSL